MAKGQLSGVVRCLRRAAFRSEGATLTDGDLLDRYLAKHDDAAFESLLERHGAMVMGVCRRILRNEADAQDAFQATFLVFVRKAACIQPRAQVGNWLYGVAHKTSLKVKATNRLRTVKERQGAAGRSGESKDQVQQELHILLDRELSHLPEKYRSSIVLCELEGKSLKEAAQQLGCPPGTIASRLARAREMLARRLAHRGLSLSVGALVLELTREAASAGVPGSLFVSTVQAATAVAAGQAATGGAISSTVVALTEGMVKTMLLTKLKSIAAAILAVTLVVGGGTLLTYRTLGAEQNDAKQKARSRVAAQEEKAKPGKHDKDPKAKPEGKTYGFLGVILKSDDDRGTVLVHEVFPDSPAAKAGVKPEDTILKVGAVRVKDTNSAVNALKVLKPGDKVTIHFQRDDKEMDATITLGKWPADEKDGDKPKTKDSPQTEKAPGYFGLVLEGDADKGAVIVHKIYPNSPAAKAGFKPDDVILKVGKRETKDPNDAIEELSNLKTGDRVTFHIKRGDKEMDVTVTASKRPADFGKM